MPPPLIKRPPPYIQPDRRYLGPSVPVAYDAGWQLFTNLTPAQIAWFQAQPEWQNFLAYVAISPATAVAAISVAAVNTALQAAGKTPAVAKITL